MIKYLALKIYFFDEFQERSNKKKIIKKLRKLIQILKNEENNSNISK